MYVVEEIEPHWSFHTGADSRNNLGYNIVLIDNQIGCHLFKIKNN